MTVLKLKADGSVEEAASASAAPAEARGGDGYCGNPPHVAFNGEAANPAIQCQ